MSRRANLKLWSSLLCAVLGTCQVGSTDIFTGPDLSFTKAPFADPSLPANQDRITDNVWLTRGDVRGLYNAAQESSFTNFVSPMDTRWAFSGFNGNPNGSSFNAANFSVLTFTDWQAAHDSDPTDAVDIPGVVHLIGDDHYIDIMFTDWGVGNNGGGAFTYVRATESVPGDFNDDGDYDCDDINALSFEIGAGTNNIDFDLTGDGMVGAADLSQWLQDAGGVNLGSAYPGADANLDGAVDGQDFAAWSGFKFQAVDPMNMIAPQGFCDGDFNADNIVNGRDFLLWNALKFVSATEFAKVPEPAGGAMWLATALILSAASRCRT